MKQQIAKSWLAAAALFFAAPVAVVRSADAPAPTDRVVLPAGVVPTHYDLEIVTDAANMKFSGSVRIDVEIVQPTSRIVLNATDLVFGKVSLAQVNAAQVSDSPKIRYDIEQQTATLTFSAPVAAGKHTLSIDYTGKINQHPAGLFALDYDSARGKQRALFTQFENSDARRFIPCWEEPARKATFTLSATVPAEQMALSNMPIATTEKLAQNLKRVHFAPSPKMSSYLLFFGTGDFERVAQKVNGIDVGVVVKRGDTGKASYALDAAAHILPYYEDYFDYKYPLPKMDLIAGPGESQFFGAMENWGAVFYFESDLLIDPKLATQSDRRNVYIVVAHETAHQWFGDLVTMDWWDSLWLNEGFASWMEIKSSDHFHPEWKLWLDSLGAKFGAMRTDARQGTHPIIQPIRDVLQANQAFDTITYSKGQAVIRMLENYVGEDTFRAGVRRYIKTHAYANTVSDDLWHALDQTSQTNVTDIAHDFTLQAGVPLIRVATKPDGVTLSQDRFSDDDSGKQPTSWRVPVLKRPLASEKLWHGIVIREQLASIAGDGGAIINAGQAGYFRTQYDAAALAPLVTHFHKLSADDQLGLLNDSRALGYTGDEPLSDFLSLADQAKPSMDPAVLDALIGDLQGIDRLYNDLPGQGAFRTFARRLLDPIFAKIGWNAALNESQNTTLLRATLLRALSQFDDHEIVDEAKTRFAAYLKNPSSLSGDLRVSVLEIVAVHADDNTWNQLHTLAKQTDDTLEKQRYFTLLGVAHNSELADRALQVALSDEAPVTTRPTIISAVSHRFPQQAFDFTVAHLDAVMAFLEPDSRTQYVPRLASNSYDTASIPKLRAYADAHIPADARREAVKSEATINYNVKVRIERLPDIDR